MNRCIRLFALVLALIVLTAGALAEGTLTPMQTLDGAEWIDGTSLLAIETDGLEAMANLDGTALTEAVYTNFDSDYGVVTAARPDVDAYNAYGALRADGTELMPFVYGDIEVLSPEWAVGYKLTEADSSNYDYTVLLEDDVYLLIDTADVYNLLTGECLATFTRDEFADATAVGHSLNVENRASGEVTTYDLSFNALGTVNSLYDDSLAQMDVTTFYERGTGLMDGEGNVIADPVYDSIGGFYGGYAYVSLDDKYGLIDEAGNIALAIEYDDVDTSYYLPLSGSGEGSGYNAFGYFAVELDGKLGYVDEQGNVTCEPKYSVDVLDNNGASATYTDLEGKFHILAADGVETVVEGYEDVYPLNYLGGMFYRVTNEDYDYGVIDWHGNVVLPAQYNSINASGDGMYLLADVDYETQELYEVTLPAVGDAASSGDSTAQDNASVAEPAQSEPASSGNFSLFADAGEEAAEEGAAEADVAAK